MFDFTVLKTFNIKCLKLCILFFILLFLSNSVFAGSCIMISPENISKIECKNNSIADFHILSTLLNEKKSVIVSSVSDGETTFVVKLKNKNCNYKLKVSNGEVEIKGDSYIKILPIDLPPELGVSGGNK